MRKAFIFILLGGIIYVWAGTNVSQSNPHLLINRVFEAFDQMVKLGTGGAQKIKLMCDSSRQIAADLLKENKISKPFYNRYKRVLDVLMAFISDNPSTFNKTLLKEGINRFGVIENKILPPINEFGIGAFAEAVRSELLDLKHALPQQDNTSSVGTGSKPHSASLSSNTGTSPLNPEALSGNYLSIVSENDIVVPAFIKKISPVFPKEALKKGLKGQVIFRFMVDIFGRPKNLEMVKGDPIFLAQSKKALLECVFDPTIRNGIPCEVPLSIVVEFK